MTDDVLDDHGRDEGYIWRYTTIEELLNIVRNNTIWAGHVYFMNDMAEDWYGRDLISKAIPKTRRRSICKARFEHSYPDSLDSAWGEDTSVHLPTTFVLCASGIGLSTQKIWERR